MDDLTRLMDDYLNASLERRQFLTRQHPDLIKDPYLLSLTQIFDEQKRSSTSSRREISSLQGEPKTGVNKPSRTPLQPTTKNMKKILKDLPKIYLERTKAQIKFDVGRQKIVDELCKLKRIQTCSPPSSIKLNKKNLLASPPALVIRPPPRELREVLCRIDEEMARVGHTLLDSESPEGVLAHTQLYYDRVHRDKTELFPSPHASVFPSGKELRDFQWEGVRWLGSLYRNGLNGILADHMGLGKTIQVVAFLALLRHYASVAGPHIVLAPLSLLPQWQHEFLQWAPSMKVVTITEIDTMTKLTGFDVLCCHYELLVQPKNRMPLYRKIMKMNFCYLIADEGHRLKNSSALTFSRVCKVHAQHRLILTGTPLQNNLQEVFVLLHFVMPSVFGADFEIEALQTLCSTLMQRQGDGGVEADGGLAIVLARLHQFLRPFILRREKDVAPDIPADAREVCLLCPLTEFQKREIEALGDKRATLHNLRKIALHPYLCRRDEWEFDEAAIEASGKLVVLDRLLCKLLAPAAPFIHKVVVFCLWTKVLDVIELFVEHRGWGWRRLDGRTSAPLRQQYCAEFCDPETPSAVRVFLISKKAGGHGLNLQAADTVILFDTDYNPAADDQALARVSRIGQKQEVRLLRLVAGEGLEDRILSLSEAKTREERHVIHAAKLDQTSSVQERFQVLHNTLQGEGLDGKVLEACNPANLSRILSRSEEEYALFRELDAAEGFAMSHKKRTRDEETREPLERGLKLVLRSNKAIAKAAAPLQRLVLRRNCKKEEQEEEEDDDIDRLEWGSSVSSSSSAGESQIK